MWPITSLFFPSSLFNSGSQCLPNLKFKFFFFLFTLFKMLFHFYSSFSFDELFFFLWFFFLSSFFFSFFFSNYILLYFAEKLIDHKEDEVFSKEDEIPKNQHYSIFIVWNLNHFLSSFFSVYILSFSLHL
jgi:hypothetical protein